jgi:exodeoxyribonuclease VII large subunit
VSSAEAVVDNVIEVSEFYRLITEHLESSFGRRHPRWVRGEIVKVYEKSHLYVDVADASAATSDAKRAVLNAHCWASQWAPIKRALAESGVVLKPGMIVSFYGYVDVYAPQGRLGFTVTDVDVTSLLGDVARRRAELIARLGAEGLLEANKRVALVAVPLRIGLVASPQTEGFSDFTGQLLRSGYSFDIRLVTTLVQGEAAPPQIVRALHALDEADVDVICIVRGGGSKGDLACFDDERVARAIAACRTAVFTGIGHTGDESVADLVAHTRAITPTKLGEDVVTRVTEWRERFVVNPARRVLQASDAVLDEAENYVGERRRTMNFAVRDRLRAEVRHLVSTRERLDVSSRRLLEGATRQLDSARQLLAAYDPSRRLAQGWSIVTTRDGRLVSALATVSPGDEVSVRVSDGSFISVVKEKGTP